jgi:uncharacterized membrane protein YgaE (UPF0421/DUF939 family)
MASGPFWFGVVLGFITYRTLKHKTHSGISDIAAVVAAIGGAAVGRLFPGGTDDFNNYCIGLAIGFFGYLAFSIIIAVCVTKQTGETSKGARAANEFLG